MLDQDQDVEEWSVVKQQKVVGVPLNTLGFFFGFYCKKSIQYLNFNLGVFDYQEAKTVLGITFGFVIY